MGLEECSVGSGLAQTRIMDLDKSFRNKMMQKTEYMFVEFTLSVPMFLMMIFFPQRWEYKMTSHNT